MRYRDLAVGAACAAVLHVAALRSFAVEYSIQNGKLAAGSRVVMNGLPEGYSVVPDPAGVGCLLKVKAPSAAPLIALSAGNISGMARFTSAHRDEPFWMLPAAGTRAGDVKLETQWLLADCGDAAVGGRYVMMVPMFDGSMCFTLSGASEGLKLTGETDDPALKVDGGVAMFVAIGSDPYKLAEDGAAAVMKHLGTGKLRREKPFPAFASDFGWCTWDSFYKDVTADKVRAGLQSFKDGGIDPRFIILDDGWQDYKKTATGEDRLVSLMPDQTKFGGDLTPTVKLAKNDFKIKNFIVWHAFMGYWGGVDGSALPDYDVRTQGRSFSLALLTMHDNLNTQWWGHNVGVIPADKIAKFYRDYYDRLKAQGVDGVKVDSQSALEGVAAGMGGRLALTQAYRKALEDSVEADFRGQLINCMANAQETYYCSPKSTLMRTSIDFWPTKPETHGQHLYTNAQMGIWFGQFMQPDWDMFQSGHAMGSFHAAGRAVSGGPVYVSDTPTGHDFKVLSSLVLSDGTILRASDVGRATVDCLFSDVTKDPVLLKVFNYNGEGAGRSGVIGAFNANYHANQTQRTTLAGDVSPSDIPGLSGEEFAVLANRSGNVRKVTRSEKVPVSLAEGTWDIFSFVPVSRGVAGGIAVMGLADKLNSAAAVTKKTWAADGTYRVTLRDGGQFVAWSEKAPKSVAAAGQTVKFEYDAASGKLSAELPAKGAVDVVIAW